MVLTGLRSIRERGWVLADAGTYADAWRRFGGSVATHPLVVQSLSDLAGISVRYLVHKHDDGFNAAIATWGRHLALSKEGLASHGKKGLFDLGNAEIILPMSSQARINLRHSARYVSALHQERIHGLKKQTEELGIAKKKEEFSRKFLYNRRRELRLLEEAGGIVRPLAEFSAEELAAIYCDLFQRRWGFAAPASDRVREVFERLRQLMTGSLIFLDGLPIAFQVLYRAESPRWISIQYVNGGIDPQADRFSPGSVLTFVNLRSAWEDASCRGKMLRYSFGRLNHEYKRLWCRSSAAFQAGWTTVQKQRYYALRSSLGKLKRSMQRDV